MSHSASERLAALRAHLASAPRTGRLQGQVAIVTGAGSLQGIGAATAKLFAHEGVQALYCLDFVPAGLKTLKQELNKNYPDVKVTVVQADAADESAISAICKRAVEEEGKLDIFFANAGKAHYSPTPLDVTPQDFNEIMRINSLSCFLAIKHASEAMKVTSSKKKSSSGSIILTASVAGIRYGAGGIEYSASKAAVINLASHGANDLTGTNIRVNAVCPGLIETGMTTLVFDYARGKGNERKIGQINPTKRYGVPEEIARAVLFLASEDASYVNGIALPVDGGLSSSHPTSGRNV